MNEASISKVVAIIQARMGSSRLPGKILKDIEGSPMLLHIVNRLKACTLIDAMIVATTVEKDDDVVEEFCQKQGIEVFRGSEQDVLDRYYRAAQACQADVVVRITADCPVIDPRVTDHVISSYLKNQDSCDFASNAINHTYPYGLDTEVTSFQVLKSAWENAKEERYREHVMPYIVQHPELFRLKSVENKEDLSYLRWTVDQKEDLELIRQIYKRLYSPGKIFYMEDILDLLDKEPFLKEINKDVKQKRV